MLLIQGYFEELSGNQLKEKGRKCRKKLTKDHL
jgi:hypothetical protein